MKASTLAEALVAILILSILLPPVYLLLRQSRVGKDRLRITEEFWSAAQKYLDQREPSEIGPEKVESLRGESFRIEVVPRFEEEDLVISFVPDGSAIRPKKLLLKNLPAPLEPKEIGP